MDEIHENEELDDCKTIKTVLPKTLTGINGLDDITLGGIPQNRTTLLVGAIGAGKTVLSMAFIVNGILKYNEPGVFMTFEEKADELQINLLTLGYDLATLISDKKLYLENLYIGNEGIQVTGKYNIEGLFVRIEQAIEKVKAKRIVLDSLDTLFSGLDSNILRGEIKRLFTWLKEKEITAIITGEIGETHLTRMGIEEAIADCVIELNNRVCNQISTRRMRVVKYRGSDHSTNEYPFVINNKGIIIYPIIDEEPQQEASRERISTGIFQLDQMLENKGYYVGSSILIAGAAGTGKTSLAAAFAASVCKNNKRCLYCSFEESPNQLIRDMGAIGFPLESYVNSENLKFYFARPTLQNFELHIMSIKSKIKEFKPDVIIMDPITNIMVESINSDTTATLNHFIDFVKMEKNITILFTSAMTTEVLLINPSYEGIFSMVDTCIMLQVRRIEMIHVRSLFIMKSRGINNSKEEKEFLISAKENIVIPNSRMVISENGIAQKSQMNSTENSITLQPNLISIIGNGHSERK